MNVWTPPVILPEPGVAKPGAVLVADSLVRRFGGVTAVDVAHLEVQPGVITSVIGPNGAGKSTLYNLVSGFDKPQAGSVYFDGERVSGRFAYKVARAGLVRTFQIPRALDRLTVHENMLLGARNQRGERLWAALFAGLWRSQERAASERADALLEEFKLAHMRDKLAGTLSGGQRKLLEMARALMTEPRMILLDEPMAGVNPALRQTIAEHIVRMRDDGTTILNFIEHDMDVVMSISDWVVVLSEGRVIAEGPPESVARDQQVIDAYLGARRGHGDDTDAQDGSP